MSEFQLQSDSRVSTVRPSILSSVCNGSHQLTFSSMTFNPLSHQSPFSSIDSLINHLSHQSPFSSIESVINHLSHQSTLSSINSLINHLSHQSSFSSVNFLIDQFSHQSTLFIFSSTLRNFLSCCICQLKDHSKC